MSEPEATQIALQYRKPTGGRIMVWPSVRDFKINDNTAVFQGEVVREPRDPDDSRATMSRIFAVKAPEMPMDITDEVLMRWSNANGVDFTNAVRIASVVSINEKEGQRLEIHFAFWNNNDWPRLVSLNWNQIADITRDVKEHGVVRKDRVWGTSYIEKEYKPEVQKSGP